MKAASVVASLFFAGALSAAYALWFAGKTAPDVFTPGPGFLADGSIDWDWRPPGKWERIPYPAEAEADW